MARSPRIVKDTDGNKYAEIDVETIGETELAVRFNDGDRKFWIPKSCLEDWPDVGETGTALVIRWFAEKEKLI